MAENSARLFIALYTDADVNQELALQLRQQGFDAVSARDLGHYRLTDEAQLDYAISQQRTILTFNIKHFVPLFERYWSQGTDHYGIIVSEQLPLGELLRRMLRLLDTVTTQEMQNNFKNLGEFA
jgi:hypothetical protein